MLLNGYINFALGYVKYSLVLGALLFLVGCATPSDSNKTATPETLKTLSSDIVDMVNTEGQRVTQNKDPINNAQHQNLYLKQQKILLANINTELVNKYQQAVSFIAKKDYQKADVLLDEIILAAPKLSGVYVNKAVIAYQQNKNAEYWLDKAIAVNKLNPYAHNFKGLLQRQKGNFIQAKQSYLNALASWPDFTEAHLNLAILLELYRGQLLQARMHYQAYLKLKPDDKKVQAYLAGLDIKIKRAGLVIPKTEPKLDSQKEVNNVIN